MNKLEHLAEFQELLAEYHISEAGRAILAKTTFAPIAAPTSTGQNTIIQGLLKTGKYHFVVSDTTREPRINNGVMEKNGVVYWFKDEVSVLESLKRGEYIAPAVIHNQQVSGMSINEFAHATKQGKIATTDVETVGIDSIIPIKPDTLPFFLLPPSFDEWMRRINTRGKMTESERHRRLKSAINQFTTTLAQKHYIFVVNDLVERAVQLVDEIVETGNKSLENQANARQLAQTLLIQTKEYLGC